MKRVLIAYFSQTGNTEKIAKAIQRELEADCTAVMKKIEDVTASDREACDFLFIGSPCHAGDLSAPAKDFIKGFRESPKLRAASFITHAAPAYRQEDFTRCIASIEALCAENNIAHVKTFDCQGYLNPQIHEMVKKMKNFSDQDWAKNVREMEGHPNAEDERNAALFAREIVGA